MVRDPKLGAASLLLDDSMLSKKVYTQRSSLSMLWSSAMRATRASTPERTTGNRFKTSVSALRRTFAARLNLKYSNNYRRSYNTKNLHVLGTNLRFSSKTTETSFKMRVIKKLYLNSSNIFNSTSLSPIDATITSMTCLYSHVFSYIGLVLSYIICITRR